MPSQLYTTHKNTHIWALIHWPILLMLLQLSQFPTLNFWESMQYYLWAGVDVLFMNQINKSTAPNHWRNTVKH